MDGAKRELVAARLTKAQHDLASARKLAEPPDSLLDTALYHCQQSAEKAVKVLHCGEVVIVSSFFAGEVPYPFHRVEFRRVLWQRTNNQTLGLGLIPRLQVRMGVIGGVVVNQEHALGDGGKTHFVQTGTPGVEGVTAAIRRR